MTIPDDIRAKAEALVNGMEWSGDSPHLDGLQDAIADALMAERERCAKIAIHRAEHHREHCEPECKCANGWHIAIEIRSPDTGPST